MTIAAGPGGVFGNDVYAISAVPVATPRAINRPGVIYRVDPATGKASVFFDLNTVLSQIDPDNTTAATPGGQLARQRDGAGQLVQHHVRSRRDLQRHVR